MLSIVDYGVGNLFSLSCSLKAVGAEVTVTGDEKVLARAERIILPGVGAFGDAAQALRASGLDKAVCREAARGKPLLGICLGMQLLFDYSTECGPGAGSRLCSAHPPDHPPVVQGAPHRLERPPLPQGQAGQPSVPVHPRGGLRLLCSLLRRGGLHRTYHCHRRVRPGTDGGCGPRQRIWRPIPPGEERTGWTEHPEGFLRNIAEFPHPASAAIPGILRADSIRTCQKTLSCYLLN